MPFRAFRLRDKIHACLLGVGVKSSVRHSIQFDAKPNLSGGGLSAAVFEDGSLLDGNLSMPSALCSGCGAACPYAGSIVTGRFRVRCTIRTPAYQRKMEPFCA